MSDKLQAAMMPPSKEQINALVQLFGAGRYREALIMGRGLAKQHPHIPFFPNLLGIIHFHQGNLDSAVTSFNKALALNPNYDEVHNNLGNVLKELGRFDEALACYHQAIRIRPDYPEAHNNLATVFIELKQFDEAIDAFRQAIAIKPDYARAYQNLGDLLFDLERYDEAISNYAKALQTGPESYELLINHSIALREKRRNEEALTSANKAVHVKPDNASAHNNLGNALAALGRYEEAISSFESALQFSPDYADAHSNLGNVLKISGQKDEALANYVKAVSIDPEQDSYWRNLSVSLKGLTFTEYTPQWVDIFQGVLDRQTIARPSEIVSSIVNLLKQQADIQKALQDLSTQGIEKQLEDICVKLSEMPLVTGILALCPVPDLEFEHLLTVLRKQLLLSSHLVSNKSSVMPFQVALALNCFTNEFIFEETDEEVQAVEALQQELEACLSDNKKPDPYKIACLASYRPLNTLSTLSEQPAPAGLELLFERQINEVKTEEQCRSNIWSVKTVQDEVSTAVKQQYEENPYPRWVNTQVLSKSFTIPDVIKELGLKLADQTISFSNDPEILIAGCGTGQHSIATASRFSNSKVLAIDLSFSSLSYAIRKTTELGIDNIEYLQGDILDLGTLNKQFDIVESAGVLHHMNDPMAGWAVLVDCLKPGGLMKIALYSETARQHVVKARELIQQRGLSSTPEDMKALRKEINGSEDELLSKLRNYRDLFSLSELRDLLFHVQEHRFTLPQIKSSLETLGLGFVGFEPVIEEYSSKFKQSYSEPDAVYDLDIWHEFEQNHPDVFSGMYQFWVQKQV